jgi:hypothetical protein
MTGRSSGGRPFFFDQQSQKRVGRWFLDLSLRFTWVQCRSLPFFANPGKQTKQISLAGKGCSGVCGKASIGRCYFVSRGNEGVVFCRQAFRQDAALIRGKERLIKD